MKFLQRIIDAVFGLYTIKSPWTNHDVKKPLPDPDTTQYAKVIFYHHRDCYVFERSFWRFLDVSFPRETVVADILRQNTKLYEPDINDLFIHMRTNVEFTVPVPMDKVYHFKKGLRNEGFTILSWCSNPYP